MKKITLGIVMILNTCVLQAANFYWTGGAGDWSNFTNHWATTSGGTVFHTSPPGPSDDVFFDGGSFTGGGLVTISQPNIFCKNFTWLNVVPGGDLVTTDTSYKISIFGSIIIDVQSDISYDGVLSFESPVGGNSITIMDTVNCKIRFNGPGSDWTLASGLNTKNEINLISGTLDLNSFPFSCTSFISNYGTPGRTLIPGTTELRILNYDYDVWMSVIHYWKVDNLLSLNASNNDLVFETIMPEDTTNFSWGGIPFSLQSGNQNYRNVFVKCQGFIPAGNDSFLIIANVDMAFNASTIQTIKLDNCTWSYLSGNIDVDSITATIVDGIGPADIGISISNTTAVNYIEGGDITISTGINNNFEKVIATGNLTIDSWFLPTPNFNVNTFGDVYVGGNFSETNATLQDLNPNTFRKCVIMGDGIFHSDTCIFDTLMFSEGHEYIVESGKTVITNNQFIAFGSAGNSIQLHASTIGTQANMTFNQNDVCSDYLFLRDMNASGTNVMAGANSQNIANNTGWQFVPCSVVSNVWPGDANYDLIVNNFDLLNIGLAFGETGPARAGASNNYVAQAATDWSSYFISAVNKKHADCDGNGIVDADDTLAVSLNYGLSHPARLTQNEQVLNSGIELSFQVPTGAIVPGSVVTIPILLGTSLLPADSIYGIAFTVNYDPSFIDQATMYADYSGSWIGNTGNSIHLEKDFYSAGKFDVALTRTDHNSISGSGMIGTLIFVTANNAGGLLNLSFSNVVAITNTGTEIPVIANSGTIMTGMEDIEGMEKFSLLYPNPFYDKATLVFSNPEHKRITLRVTDITGKEILQRKITGENKTILEGNDLSKGMFLYELKGEDGRSLSRGKFVVDN